MYLHLLELVYAVRDRETVEAWLSQEKLGHLLLSTQQYDDEILAVLAHERPQPLIEAERRLRQQPAISSYTTKRRMVCRVETMPTPEEALRSFPWGEGEEWYAGGQHIAYLCFDSHHFCDKQISWLAVSNTILSWRAWFALPYHQAISSECAEEKEDVARI